MASDAELRAIHYLEQLDTAATAAIARKVERDPEAKRAMFKR